MEYQKSPFGLVHGRFQLLHHGHMKYILAAKDKCEFLYIGLTSPQGPFTEAEASKWAARPEDNPFSFSERKAMIEVALTEKGVSEREYEVIEFPSNYQNIEEYVPKGTKFFLTIYDDLGYEKLSTLKTLGFDTEVLMTLTKDERGVSAGMIREMIKKGDASWERYTEPAVVSYLKNHNLLERLLY